MNELRKDPLLNKWVAVLSDSKPPEYYLKKINSNCDSPVKEEESCILCQGREHETPEELFSIRDNPYQFWHTRVIPRHNPILGIEGELGRRAVGIYDKMNSIGANEIIVESPLHNKPPEDMGIEQMIRIIRTYLHRVSDLEKDPRFRYTLIYKDCGKLSGELYEHPHSQVVATPVIPKGIKDELDGAKAYYYYKERCVFCDIMNEERTIGKRIILDTEGFIVFTPFAPRFPFECWVMPKKHNCAFQEISDKEIEDLGFVLIKTLKSLKAVLNNPPYSYVVHTAPNRMPRRNHWHTLGDDFHWHIEIMPNLAAISSFERTSEFYILTTSPEDAAMHLRDAAQP